MNSNWLSRRTTLKLIGLSSIARVLPACAVLPQKVNASEETPPFRSPQSDWFSTYGPIDRTTQDDRQAAFSGDRPRSIHSLLWDKDQLDVLRQNLPSPSEDVPLVIIGGGVSGVGTAYLLKEHHPVVLEQAPRFGGNAKAESWNGMDYSIGAAYFLPPDEGSDLERLYKELQFEGLYREKKEEDPIAFHGHVFKNFWKGEMASTRKVKSNHEKKSNRKAKAQYETLKKYFLRFSEKSAVDLPYTKYTDKELVMRLDRISFLDHLKEKVGGHLNPEIEAAIEYYCWSSFGASASEISAAAGVNFYSFEFGGLSVCPGGNAAVAEQIIRKTLESGVPQSHFRSNAKVFHVAVENDSVIVAYKAPKNPGDQSSDGDPEREEVRVLRARAVVMACPLFVSKKVIKDLDQDKVEAISSLQYRSFLVGNALLRNLQVKDEFYDLFNLGSVPVFPNGQRDAETVKAASLAEGVTDCILVNFARANKRDTVLTLYRGLPYQGARHDLLDDNSLDQCRQQFRESLERWIFPTLKIHTNEEPLIRVARWGHPLPVPTVGQIAGGTVEVLRRPFKDRLFFISQDTWALPAFETGISDAFHFRSEILRHLNGPSRH
ncbi:MAG: hypothetical protein C5B49_16245 [Bdellovibrio sp.]|nr:MAG: hypothetical protein C5B49_16245 [Bdellovibrio sp.]